MPTYIKFDKNHSNHLGCNIAQTTEMIKITIFNPENFKTDIFMKTPITKLSPRMCKNVNIVNIEINYNDTFT